MRRFVLFLFIFFLVCGIIAQAEEWDTLKSTHFVVYYKKAPEDFVKKISDRAEELYNKITADLGFNRFDFWLWDNRAKIYIYDDAVQFQTTTGNPAWVGGVAIPKLKTIATFYYAKNTDYSPQVSLPDFLNQGLPHEMTHIIFREFVGFSNTAIPLWLEEGVASYQEKDKYDKVYALLKYWRSEKRFMDLKKLSQFSALSGIDDKTAGVFYAEAFTVVDFLMKEFGRDRFVLFCQNLRDKKNFEQALVSTYSLRDIGELDSAWQRYLWHE
ncbi:MAG: peptidase MA family metallohydrolase [Candidatus Omnitrophica bacterium]|nr:peptidase MA family metallohydrolase [Candidatus Omnitrophota bacterium]